MFICFILCCFLHSLLEGVGWFPFEIEAIDWGNYSDGYSLLCMLLFTVVVFIAMEFTVIHGRA